MASTGVTDTTAFHRSDSERLPAGMSARWRWLRVNWRNRLLMNRSFQRWSARLPLVRLIANKHATDLHHITAGFVYSQVLQACVQLNVFDQLLSGPAHTRELQALGELSADGWLTLLRAASSLELLEQVDSDYWALGRLGAAMAAFPGISAMVDHHALLYRDLVDPVHALKERRSTELSKFWSYAEGQTGAKSAAHYSALMADSLTIIADHVLDACNLKQAGHLMDIGGGTGRFAALALARHPQLVATVADLPDVVNSPEALNRQNSVAQLRFVGVNALKDPLPTEADVISLVRILHDHDDDKALAFIKAARQALPEGGQLIVAEPMANTAGAKPIGHAYFGIYLWAMRSGRPRTADELGQLLRAGGFSEVKEHKSHMPSLVRVITASAISDKNY